MENKKYNWIGSSTNPDNIGVTANGIMVAFIPLVLIGLKNLGFDFTQDQIFTMISQLSGGISASLIIFGIIRKIFVRIFLKK